MADDDKKELVLLGPEVEGGGHRCLRYTGKGEVLSGTLMPLKEGVPINSELVEIRPSGVGPLYVGESVYTPPTATQDGPAKVNSRKYLSGWDRIFGDKTVGVA